MVGKEGLNMKTAKLFNTTLILGIVALLIAMIGLTSLASADDGEETAETQTTQAETTSETADESTAEESNTNFNYVAQPGDSYTEMARKAVQTYGINSGTNLSGAQIVFVETNLTQAAGSPKLTLGQNVTINEDDVKQLVTKAQTLTEAQTAAWQVYADNVDFNTDSVGQAS